MGWKNYTGLLVFAALIGVAPWALPHTFFYLIQIGIYALICIGLSLLMGYAGQISLGHAAFYAIGAYTSGILTMRLGCSPWIAVWAGVALSIAVALAIGLPSLRLHGHYLAMATLAFGEIVNVILKAWIPLTNGPSGFGQIPRWNLFGFELAPLRCDREIFYFVWGTVLLGLVVALNLIHSRVGRALRSIHDGEQAANVLGVATASYKIKVFVLSAVYASIAGSLYAHIRGYLNPNPFGVHTSILLIIMVIAGGMRTVWGAIVGAIIMGLLPEALADLEQWRFLIYGLILLVITMFVPQGLLLGSRDFLLWLVGLFRRARSEQDAEVALGAEGSQS